MYKYYILTCTVSQKKKQNIPINSNTNCRREMKLVPIYMDYCLHQFDALKIPNFGFFNANPQI